MSLNALSTANAGLAATQAAINIVSQNVANAGTAGYVKRTLTSVSSGIGNSGVATGTITRSFDDAALKQLRLETAGSSYTSTTANVVSQLDKLYGTPGDSSALDGLLNSFTQSLQNLAANPTQSTARTVVLNAAASLSTRIGGIAGSVQNLRTDSETRLGTQTTEASNLLSSIAGLNVKIQGTSDDAARADLLDQRDQQITQLSGYFDVQTVTQRDGTVTVLTGSGVTLVDRGKAAVLSFDGRGQLGPSSTYSADPSKRSVGTILATTPGGGTIDLGEPGVLRSGSIAAELDLRDNVLPKAQRQLDDLASGMARSLTDKTVAGTKSGTGYAVDLTGIQAGNAITVPVTINGAVRNVTLVASQKGTTGVDPSLTSDNTGFGQTFDISGGPSTYAAKIQEALGALSTRLNAAGASMVPNLTAGPGSGATVVVSGVTGGNTTVTGASAGITVPTSASDLSTAFPQLPLFVDGSGNALITGNLDGSAQITGLAQRLAVNPAVVARSAALVPGSAGSTTPDSVRPQFLYDALTSAPQTFSSSSGIGGISAPYSTTVVGFAQDVIAAQGAAASSAQSLDEGQSVALATAQGRFSASAGVNIDEEMSRLIELQTAYSANARVLTAARDMLNTLLQM